MRMSVRRWAVMLSVLACILAPLAAEAWVASEASLVGTWDTWAHVDAGPDAGTVSDGWIELSQGCEAVTGTFHATIGGVLTNGTINGTQRDGRLYGQFAAHSPNPYRLSLKVEISSDGTTFSGSWSDNHGRSGRYQGVRRTGETTDKDSQSETGRRVPWNLLLASWALLGAAMLSRGASKLPRTPGCKR